MITDELHDMAYKLFCDDMTYDIRTSGYTKKKFIEEYKWFWAWYEKAIIKLRKDKIKKIKDKI